MSASVVSESKKSAPWLQIVMLVVGTRGDVQPFLAIAKKLQACLFRPILPRTHESRDVK